MFFKIGVLKNIANFTGKRLCWSLFLINLQALRLYLRETPAQVLSSEICGIFKITQVAASESLRNVFAEQMFTLQLSNIVPTAILKKKCLPLIAKRSAGNGFGN